MRNLILKADNLLRIKWQFAGFMPAETVANSAQSVDKDGNDFLNKKKESVRAVMEFVTAQMPWHLNCEDRRQASSTGMPFSAKW